MIVLLNQEMEVLEVDESNPVRNQVRKNQELLMMVMMPQLEQLSCLNILV